MKHPQIYSADSTPLSLRSINLEPGVCHATHLSVQVVGEVLDELTLDRILSGEQRQVVSQLVVQCDDGAVPERVVLRTPRAPKNLHHVQNAQVHHCSFLRIINVCSLSKKPTTD